MGIAGVVCRCEASGVRAGRKGWVAMGAVDAMDVRHFARAQSNPIHLLGSVKDEPHLLGKFHGNSRPKRLAR